MAKHKLTKKEQVALHRRDMARRRQKPKTFGKLKKEFTTKSGKVVKNPGPTGFDKRGRPIIAADALINVWDFQGNEMEVTPRAAAALITAGVIPAQMLGTFKR